MVGQVSNWSKQETPLTLAWAESMQWGHLNYYTTCLPDDIPDRTDSYWSVALEFEHLFYNHTLRTLRSLSSPSIQKLLDFESLTLGILIFSFIHWKYFAPFFFLFRLLLKAIVVLSEKVLLMVVVVMGLVVAAVLGTLLVVEVFQRSLCINQSPWKNLSILILHKKE